jgi:hypothetical protein
MNKRIRAHDLWTQVCQEDMPELDETCMTMRRTRKFAELIVQECIGVVEGGQFIHDTNRSPLLYMNSRGDLFQAPTALFAKECSGAIKKHFGVEE